MLQKLACHMAIIQNSRSNCTSVCIQTKGYMYVHPPYTFILCIPPFTANANVF